MILKYYTGLFLFACCVGCTFTEPSPSTPQARFGSNEIALYEMADRGRRERIPHISDSLERAGLLTRKLQLLSLELSASPGDSSAIGYIFSALNDTGAEVRSSAAWAIGIIGLESSADILISLLETEKTSVVRAGLWEALGKCLPAGKYPLFMEVPAGSTETEGWLKGWYAQVLKKRDVPLPESLIGKAPEDSAAAFWYWHVLARSRYEIPGFEDAQIQEEVMRQKAWPEMSCAIASAAWRVQDSIVINHLGSASLDKSLPAPLRSAFVRSLAPKGAYDIREIQALLQDPEYQVRKTMADQLKGLGKTYNWQGLESNCPETLALLLEAQYMQSKEPEILRRMLDSVSHPEDPYVRSFFSSSLPYYSGWMETISGLLDTARSPLLLSSLAANAVSRFDEMTTREQQVIAGAIFRSKDSGSIAALCDFLRTWKYPPQAIAHSLLPANDLEKYRKSLVLPKETECYNAISALLREKYEKEYEDYSPAWNHPIDWALLNGVKEMKAIIFTSEGEISLDLDPYSAPGSVADFIRLSREGYYNGKYIHRVVPNFVAQGACPRGDGWGSLDYTLRTEISRNSFETGSIGLASAGKNTESCQWFITHSPTPHLNGRYTVFGTVTSGMETVNRLRVGSRILHVEISE